MKYYTFFASILMLLSSLVAVQAQTCLGVSIKENSGYEMVTYNAKGKSQGTIRVKYNKVSTSNGQTIVDVEQETMNDKGKSELKSTYQLKCSGNEILIDMASFMNSDQQKMFKDTEMKLTSDDLAFPSSLSEGQSLKDASLHGEGNSTGIPLSFKIDMTNRKVGAEENITVPAGSFKAHKVTSNMKITNKTVISINLDFETVSYRADGVMADVKTETYRKGKLVSYTELSKIF